MHPVLTINQLSKYYPGVKALDRLSLEVPAGSIFGLLGPNGSGKTTTLGIVLDVLKAGSGSFQWFGQPYGFASKRRIGAILETPNFYPYLSARQNLALAADVKGIDHRQIAAVLSTVGLLERQHTRFGGFSLGMKQRLALASALLGDPEVLVLDEPTNGLDPEGIAEVRELIQQVAAQGKTIIMASHLLDEVQKVCTHVAVLQKGQLKVAGRVDDILSRHDQLLVSSHHSAALSQILPQLPMVREVKPDPEGFLLILAEGFGPAELNEALFRQGIVLSQLTLRKKSLESQFLDIIKN